MKGLKKFLFFFLILFAFGFSNENKDSKVMLDKVRETSQLKIGVTKIKSKELPMEFDVESKKVYGEIEIEDNDLVFVSETLDEIPSVSTTNGRRVINNINKYLTKNIKESPKFNYQIVDGKTESGEKNGKKYLVIDCKEQLPSVYVYVLEKGSYKIKNVYKGAFKQLYAVQSRTKDYGSINLTKAHTLNPSSTIITFDNGVLKVNNKEESFATVTGEYPKKSFYGDLSTFGKPTTRYRVRIKNLDNNSEIIYPSGDPVRLEEPDCNIMRTAKIELKNKIGEKAGTLEISSSKESEYLTLNLELDYPYENINNKIEIDYGKADSFGNRFEVIHTDSFELHIEKKDNLGFPLPTKGEIVISEREKIWSGISTISVDDNGEVKLNGENPEYFTFEGKFIKKIEIEKSNFDNKEKILKIDVESRKGTGSGEIELPDLDGEPYTSKEINVYDVFGKVSGKIRVYSENDSPYLKLDFSNDQGKGFEGAYDIDAKISLKYIGREKDVEDEIFKEDILYFRTVSLKESIPTNTRGTLLITDPTDLYGIDLFLNSTGNLEQKKNGKRVTNSDFNPKTQTIVNGILPKPFPSNYNEPGKEGNRVNWGTNYRLRLEGKNIPDNYEAYDPEDIEKDRFNYKTGHMTSQGENDGWIILENQKNEKVGYIFFSYNRKDTDKQSIKIGFCGVSVGGGFDLDLNNSIVSETYKFYYEAQLNGKWVTKKIDVLDLVIQSALPNSKATIDVETPIVYYDYKSSSAMSNVVHNRRVHLLGNEATTLTSSGNKFEKNKNLLGYDWINVTDIPSYEWDRWKKHKITIVQGVENEVIKTTDENGRTNSSTFISGNERKNGHKNQVMFSYDGSDNHLNFGISKYNFEKEEIDVIITHYANNNSSIQSIGSYKIKIPEFKGIHYVNPNYNIKPRQSYIKNHEFNHEIGNNFTTIDYGTVGFRDLDTRITEQAGGNGIEIRAYKDVILKSESNPEYIITGAKLYFEDNISDDGGKTTLFKGENEKATYKMLKLDIPTQETLIPKGRMKILTNEAKPTYPLKVGVVVDGSNDKYKYFTQIDDEGVGEEGNNLYIDLVENRFVETKIEFENPNLSKIDASGNQTTKINWIRLNNKDYYGGKLSTSIGNSDLWGRVKGDIIDIPLKGKNNNDFDLRLKVFQKDNSGKESELLTDLVNNTLEIPIPGTTEADNRNFVMKYNKGNDYMEFSLNNGYDKNLDKGKEIEFYIRYYDKITDKFLFDQRFKITFKEETIYLGDTTVVFKNPTMLKEGSSENGMIKIFGRGESLGSDNNSDQSFDREKWWDIQNAITYPESTSYTLKNIDTKNDYPKNNIKYENNLLNLGLPEIKKELETIFNLTEYFDGKSVERSYSLKLATSEGEKNYRVNLLLEEFDPRYYGKVYPSTIKQNRGEEYREINQVGEGEVDLRKYDPSEKVYIDLKTKYRDYSRYPSIIESLKGKLKVGVENNSYVEVLAKDNGEAPVVKGKLVFTKGDINYSEKEVKSIGNGLNLGAEPENYDLRLELEQKEYKKLKPYTTYELFINGDPNIISIGILGDEKLSSKILLARPLNFRTQGPSIEIIPEILNFGQIKPKEHSEPLIVKSAEAKINVIIEDELAEEFKTSLVPSTEEIWIKEKNANGIINEGGEKLKVRSITVSKVKQNGISETGKRQDEFKISGVLEIPNKTEPKRAEYGGYVEVTFTYY